MQKYTKNPSGGVIRLIDFAVEVWMMKTVREVRYV